MPSAIDNAPPTESRLLLISNRLPITIKRSPEGKYDFSMSSGGLVTGLSGLAKSTTFQWYGWPGLEVPDNESEDLVKRLKDEFNAIPVFVDDELADRHYNGFSSECSLRLFLAVADQTQIRSCGHSSITIPARSRLTKHPGMLMSRSTGFLPRRSPNKLKMVIWSGSTITI